MPSATTLRIAGLVLASTVFVPSVLVVACSSDNATNPTPPTPTYALEASAPSGDDATAPGDDATTNPADDSSTPVADAKEEPIVREDVRACTLSQPAALGAPDAGCWNCAPQLPSDFLNKCAGTGVTCAAFDNGRLPGYDGGALPPTN
jgi:hypothetical protein